jgi:phage repressor protein C with HTH and peptisase S24 domain
MFENLKALRESAGLKQEEFGAGLGVKKSTYSNYENGKTDPPATFWVDVAEQYQVTTDYLLGMVSDPHGTKYGGATKLDASYNALDEHGRRLVDLVVDAELERMAAAPAPVIEFPRPMIQHFIVPAAAGYASPIDGEDYEMIPLPDGAPENADFCITVDGNSMEPYLHDRDLAYVKRGAPLKEYDVGVFYVSGDVLIKQWYLDRSGVLHLRGLNPAAAGANRVIPRYSQDTVVCFGKVINEKKPPRGET